MIDNSEDIIGGVVVMGAWCIVTIIIAAIILFINNDRN